MAKKPKGRPTDYTLEVVSDICARIADGQSLREIALSDDMPAKATIFLWLAKHKEFSDQYAHAKEAQALHMADEILDIADDASNDWMERLGEDGQSLGWKENGEAMQRSRLRVDSRKWLLSKLLPKKYGDKFALEHTGADGGPIAIERRIVDIAD